MSDTKKKYERPTLDAKEMFGAEGQVTSCCKTTNATCTAGTKSGNGKSTRSQTTS